MLPRCWIREFPENALGSNTSATKLPSKGAAGAEEFKLQDQWH